MKIKFRIPGRPGYGLGDAINIDPKGDVNVKTLNGWRAVSRNDIMAISPNQGLYSEPSTHLLKSPGWSKIPKSKKIPKEKWNIRSGE